jgi:hypothetical protein
MLVTASATLLAELNLIAGNLFAGCWVHLFVNPYYPTPDMDIGDFVQASFNGYQPRVVSGWTPAVVNTCGAAVAYGRPGSIWTVSITGGTDVVWGYYLATATGVLLAAENIGKPRPMLRQGQETAITPQLSLQSG